MPAASKAPVSVRLLAVEETTPAALYGLLEVFSAVGVATADLNGGASAARRMDTAVVTRGGGPFVTSRGVPLAGTVALPEAGTADIAIVTDLDLEAGLDPRGRWGPEAAWLRGQFERGATVCSVCTGTLLLAEAGVLDGVEATTHWGAADIMAQSYPEVRLRPERILCPAGPGDRIITSGGSASWVDLVLYLIARYSGPAEAMLISKLFVLGDHSDGQLPFAMMSRRRAHDDAVIARCQSWIAEHYDQPDPVARMMRLSGLAERTFKRRFRAATGYAPGEYVQTLRIEEAKQMLETSDAVIDDVALAVGYRDPASFRRVFKRRTGVTPARYRQRFRSIPALHALRPAETARSPGQRP